MAPFAVRSLVSARVAGSPLHSWYSISRNGLRNLSNTALMTTGAVHGAGVYLAMDSATAGAYQRAREHAIRHPARA